MRFSPFGFWNTLAALGVAAAATGCSAEPSHASDSEQVAQVMHASLLADIQALHLRASSLCAAAPAPVDRGWDATQDREALATTRAAWQAARTAYEHCEGALAPIFPDLDFSLDARYDDFLAQLPGGDLDLFDDQGVTGMHAIERILYADEIPERVTELEQQLDGYQPAAFPSTSAESHAFRDLLCKRMVDDARTMAEEWTPTKVDLSSAFSGLISLMNEQREKVNKASTGQEESRYSQRTMSDIRDNLAGTKKVYEVFQPWLVGKSNTADLTQDGPTLDRQIEGGFARLQALYDAQTGDAIPAPPATWSAESPSDPDLRTPFGLLYSGVRAAVNPDDTGSVVFEMRQAASVLGLNPT